MPSQSERDVFHFFGALYLICVNARFARKAAIPSTLTPFPRRQALNIPIRNTPPHQPERRKSDMCRHPSHLPVTPLGNRNPQPPVRHRLAEPNRGIAVPKARGIDQRHLGRSRWPILQRHASAKRFQIVVARIALNLNQIRFLRFCLWRRDPCLPPSIVRQNQKALAVAIQTPSRVNARRQAKLRKCPSCGWRLCIRELGQHAKWLVEKYDPRHVN